LWDEEDGYYYDQVHVDGSVLPLKLRSIVGVIPLFAVDVMERSQVDRLSGFRRRMRWFLENRFDLARHIAYMEKSQPVTITRRRGSHAAIDRLLLAVPSRERLVRVLRRVLDESELLSPYGVRSLSRAHLAQPVAFDLRGERHEVAYDPG